MDDPATLAFDTSGPFCSVALRRGGRTVSEAYAEMAKGQAEALMPMISDLMAEAGIGRRHLGAIGVGTGPGNFTGLRIAVAAARGMALGLGIPAIGISAFEVLTHDLQGGDLLASLPAPRDQVYLQAFRDGVAQAAPWLAEPDAPDAPGGDLLAAPPPRVIGACAARIAKALGGAQAQARTLPPPAAIIAELAEARLATGAPPPRPVPQYVRAPDAAPSRHAAPVILP